MDKVQLLLASLIVLVICLVIYVNNSMNGVTQPMLLKVVAGVAVVATAYLYSQLNKSDVDDIWRVAGGTVDGGTGSDYIINNY